MGLQWTTGIQTASRYQHFGISSFQRDIAKVFGHPGSNKNIHTGRSVEDHEYREYMIAFQNITPNLWKF